jgi:hypothetical protein
MIILRAFLILSLSSIRAIKCKNCINFFLLVTRPLLHTLEKLRVYFTSFVPEKVPWAASPMATLPFMLFPSTVPV